MIIALDVITFVVGSNQIDSYVGESMWLLNYYFLSKYLFIVAKPF
jgi:hypothetical protein